MDLVYDGVAPGQLHYPASSRADAPLSSHDGTWVTLDGTTLTRWRLRDELDRAPSGSI